MSKLDIDYQLKRKPPNRKNAAEPQYWVVDEVTRPARLGLVGRNQLLAVATVLVTDTDAAEGSDVAMSKTLYISLLDFELAKGEAATTVRLSCVCGRLRCRSWLATSWSAVADLARGLSMTAVRRRKTTLLRCTAARLETSLRLT